jgi:hypothetical protein
MLFQGKSQECAMYTTAPTHPLNQRPGDSTDHSADAGVAPGGSAATLTVVLERSPAALARVYSVLCLMNLVPESFGGTQVGDDLIRLDFSFGPEPERRIDLLTRKLAQLTECLEVAETPVRQRAAF